MYQGVRIKDIRRIERNLKNIIIIDVKTNFIFFVFLE